LSGDRHRVCKDALRLGGVAWRLREQNFAARRICDRRR
jgi:hypothetical protein